MARPLFFLLCGGGKNRVWYILHTKVIFSHLEVLTLNNLFNHTRYFISSKVPGICFIYCMAQNFDGENF